MAKSKCKQCSSTLPSGDKHALCEVCRKVKRTDDLVAKATEKRKSDAIDDSILDDDDPPKTVTKVAASAESNSTSSALQQTVELLAA